MRATLSFTAAILGVIAVGVVLVAQLAPLPSVGTLTGVVSAPNGKVYGSVTLYISPGSTIEVVQSVCGEVVGVGLGTTPPGDCPVPSETEKVVGTVRKVEVYNGHFSLNLPPGPYAALALPLFGLCQPRFFHISLGETTTLTMRCLLVH